MLPDAKHRESGRITINGRPVDYRVRRARHNSRLRIRVGVGGVEVLQPSSREESEIEAFIHAHGTWVLDQLDRTDRLRHAVRITSTPTGEILLRGIPTLVEVDDTPRCRGSNRVLWQPDVLIVARGRGATIPPAKSLENWLRRQARALIEPLVDMYADRLAVTPGRIYVMNQRTKWGNCSRLRNLSFNWRLVLAPDPVLRYLVAHETCHLAVPDHSQRFWLALQSICPESERARQWLVANGHHLLIDLHDVVDRKSPASSSG
jgi:predicted metal-dependent hydrolase